MQIDGFVVDGIANIERANLRIEDLCALIAPNGYGKSNVLRAIDFGVRFLSAEEAERKQMLSGRWMSINTATYGKDFSFEIAGRFNVDGEEQQFIYSYQLAWAREGSEGRVVAESLKMKRSTDQRYRQLINRSETDHCLIVPSAAGRCNKPFDVPANQLALSAIARSAAMFLNGVASQIYGIQVPNLETLDNPESYFSVGGGKGIQILGGMTLSEYLTIKGPSANGGLARYEFEKEISLSEAENLMKLCEPGMIDKTRYLVKSGKHIFEVDEFYGENKGLVMAEVELAYEDEPYEKPSFIGKEVTGDRRYYNSQLKEHLYTTWEK